MFEDRKAAEKSFLEPIRVLSVAAGPSWALDCQDYSSRMSSQQKDSISSKLYFSLSCFTLGLSSKKITKKITKKIISEIQDLF